MVPRKTFPMTQANDEIFRLMVDTVQDYAIFLLDPEGHVVSWNAGAERIKGYRAEEILGGHFSLFYPAGDVAAGKPARELQFAARDGRVEDEGWRVRKDGSQFWANVIITALRDEQRALVGFVKVTRDLTERRLAEEAVARAHAELESFSSSVSHDLRAPLRAINGYAAALIDDYADALDPEGKRLLGIVRDSASRMGDLIDALLGFARMGRKALTTGPLDMTALAKAVVEEVRQGSDHPRLEVTVHTLPRAVGDELLVRQVLANLLANALKFSRRRPRPEVEVGGGMEGDHALYYIRDNGVGFDMRYADRLFKVFSRLHHVEEFEGTGVGLALVQRIVARHGGRIWMESAPNAGATFYFTLPASPVQLSGSTSTTP
jgi:PAS domain S-box-containing protein